MALLAWDRRSFSAAETQAAADGDDEAVCVHLCLKAVLVGQLDLRHWQSDTRTMPAALMVDCLGLKDKIGGAHSQTEPHGLWYTHPLVPLWSSAARCCHERL